MKKTIYQLLLTIIVSVFLAVNSSSAQTEFAPLGAEWYYTCGDYYPAEHVNHIISEKDTLVEGSTCRVLRQYYNSSNVASQKYIFKQEQGKVYYYYQNRFNLLLDFDAQVGDTVEFTFIYKKAVGDYDNPPIVYVDTILSVHYLVEEITTNAQNLKTFTTKGIDEIRYGDGIHFPPPMYVYSEKIGLFQEFMPMFSEEPYPYGDLHRWLRCYSDAAFSFVSAQWIALSLPCNHHATIGIPTRKDENIKIYPNPTTGALNIESEKLPMKSIALFDIYGRNILHVPFSTLHSPNLDISHLPAGIYIIKIANEKGEITRKIVKQ